MGSLLVIAGLVAALYIDGCLLVCSHYSELQEYTPLIIYIQCVHDSLFIFVAGAFSLSVY